MLILENNHQSEAWSKKRLVLVFILNCLLSWLVPVFLLREIIARDWSYFNSLSAVVRSTVLFYHRLPIHDPWVLGGCNLLMNPQNRVFSPFFILDLLFVPQWANLLSLIVYSFFGQIGAYLLFKYFKNSSYVSCLGAILFVNSSWFGLHFAEGHIPFGSLQLLPMVLWAFLRFENPRMPILITLLLGIFLLDGGFYAFIFSFFLILSSLIFGLKPIRKFGHSLIDQWGRVSLCGIALLLIAAPKLYPVVTELSSRRPILEHFTVPFQLLFSSFFWPFQKLDLSTSGSVLGFHEFGCYLGGVSFVLLISSLLKIKEFRNKNIFILMQFIFWTWIGTDWFAEINPWRLFQLIPLLNNAHVQSRVWLLSFIFYLILFCKVINRLDCKKGLIQLLFIFLFIESVVVKNFPFIQYLGQNQMNLTNQFISSQNLIGTDSWGDKPYLYYLTNRSARATYEPAWIDTKVKAVGEGDYQGEIYLKEKKGKVEISYFIPTEIEINYSSKVNNIITINTNDLGYWKIMNGNGIIISKKNDLLSIEVARGTGTIQVKFQPDYLFVLLFFEIFGWTLLAGLYLQVLYRMPKKKFDYSSIPQGFYQEILEKGHPIRRAWHIQKFERVISCLPLKQNQSILDVGCFAGSFLSLLPERSFSRQVGVDILEDQIAYANMKFGTSFRSFHYISGFNQIGELEGNFDCVVSIEVIEHLEESEIRELIRQVAPKIRKGGRLVLSTPNYLSAWPIIEILVNYFSDVKYDEQHITKFNYFNCINKLEKIIPELMTQFHLDFKTTTHFISPFLAIFGLKPSAAISCMIPHSQWKNPFGSLILICFVKN